MEGGESLPWEQLIRTAALALNFDVFPRKYLHLFIPDAMKMQSSDPTVYISQTTSKGEKSHIALRPNTHINFLWDVETIFHTLGTA